MSPVLPAVLRLVLFAFLAVTSSAILYATVTNEGTVKSLADRSLESIVLALSAATESALRAGGSGSSRGGRRFSSAFGAEVFKETVDGHPFSVSAGVDWRKSWFSTVNCTFRTWDGDSGSADDRSGYAGIGYRFGIPDR